MFRRSDDGPDKVGVLPQLNKFAILSVDEVEGDDNEHEDEVDKESSDDDDWWQSTSGEPHRWADTVEDEDALMKKSEDNKVGDGNDGDGEWTTVPVWKKTPTPRKPKTGPSRNSNNGSGPTNVFFEKVGHKSSATNTVFERVAADDIRPEKFYFANVCCDKCDETVQVSLSCIRCGSQSESKDWFNCNSGEVVHIDMGTSGASGVKATHALFQPGCNVHLVATKPADGQHKTFVLFRSDLPYGRNAKEVLWIVRRRDRGLTLEKNTSINNALWLDSRYFRDIYPWMHDAIEKFGYGGCICDGCVYAISKRLDVVTPSSF